MINSGRAYVLRIADDGSSYTEVAKLVAEDGGAGAWFGRGVAIDGDVVVVGASHETAASGAGEAYVFRGAWDAGGAWTQAAALAASDGAPGDYFGRAVAISGGVLLVGAFGKNDNQGAVYAFETADGGATWAEAAALVGSGSAAGDYVGCCIAIAGDRIAAGAPFHDDTGRVHVFETGGWTETAVLTATAGGAEGDQFGSSVAVGAAGAILVGAYAVGTDRPGFGRVFEEGAGLDWAETLSVEASDGAANDQFGASVALGDDYVVVGSSNGGAAYVFGGGAYVSGAAARYGRGAAALLAAVAAAL